MRDLHRKAKRNGGRRGRGFAVVMTLFVIGLLMVLGAALTMTAVANSQNTVSADWRERAYNTAESGIADVVTGLGNLTITPTINATWVNGNTFPSQQDPAESYDYNVTFNTTGSPIVAADPLSSTGGACGSPSSPGQGCVAIPPAGVLIAVHGYYNGHQMNAEAEALSNDLNLQGYTLLTKGDAGTNGNGNIASDPCVENGGCLGQGDPAHNVLVQTDGNFNGGKGLIDGSIFAVGTATGTVPNNCSPACQAVSGANAVPFPASNNLVQAENHWKSDAVGQGHYYGPNATLPDSITVGWNTTWFINQSIDLKNIAITNNGGLIVITGSVTESGNQSVANYTLGSACNLSCSCHNHAQMIVMSTNGAAIHGQGTGKGIMTSQGVVFAPNGPATNIGNASMQAAVVAATAQIGGTAGMTADLCAAQAQIWIPGYNITGYGER